MLEVNSPEKNTSSGKDWSQQVEHIHVPNGTGPGDRRNKHPLLASTRCNVLRKPPKFGNKVKIGNKVQFGNKFANRKKKNHKIECTTPLAAFVVYSNQ